MYPDLTCARARQTWYSVILICAQKLKHGSLGLREGRESTHPGATKSRTHHCILLFPSVHDVRALAITFLYIIYNNYSLELFFPYSSSGAGVQSTTQDSTSPYSFCLLSIDNARSLRRTVQVSMPAPDNAIWSIGDDRDLAHVK